ncbi:MAG: peptidoglycan bridge formation glycyltransferase FemA/FemB family protein [Bacilli bacterium]
MEFIELKENEFRKFLDKHPLKTFLQTPEIGKLRKKSGWNVNYVGVKNKNKIVCATMLVSKKRHFGKYEFYSPRGFLIDFNDIDLLTFFADNLKKYIKKKNGYILRIDPYVIYKERDIDGNIVEEGLDNSKIVDNLFNLGFKKSQNLEQVGWMFCLDLDVTEQDLLKRMRSFTRRNINKGLKNAIHIREVPYDELSLIKDLTDSTSNRKGFSNRDLKYFQDMYKLFKPKDEINYIVAEIHLQEYIKEHKKQLEEEKDKLNTLMKNNATVEKMDKQQEVIAGIEEKISDAKVLKKAHGNIIPLSGGVFITYGDEIVYLFGGNYKEYMYLCAPYIIQWEMITRGIKNNDKFRRYNFYGIPANINEHPENYGIYDFKKGFTGYVEELIGEYELPTSIFYYIFKIISKIKK